MRCENCHGNGHIWSQLTQEYLHCMECLGSGIASCCDTAGSNVDKWFNTNTLISKRLKDARVLIVSTKFDKDGNLVEIKTLVDQKPDGK
jgi:RecJ-like exonuclease